MDRALLEPEGRIWRVEFEGVVRHVPTTKGLRYLSRLLASPGEPIPAAELEGRSSAEPRSRERARLNVTRAISSTLRRLSDVHPTLGEHLKATVRTGGSCCYRPDPRVPILWQTHAADADGREEA